MKRKTRKFATFNLQGLISDAKKMSIADDFIEYNLTMMMVQETHIKETGAIELKSSSGKTLYLYNSGNISKSINGVGIITNKSTNISFKDISDRICVATVKTKNKFKYHVISAYAPTLESTVKRPEDTKNFYDQLTSIVNKFNKRDAIIIGGDFNAKTKLPNHERCKQNAVGKYAKSHVNENGRYLIDFCSMFEISVTNTKFKHKPSHQHTWESPAPPVAPRKNPYRNQIDYIITRNNSKHTTVHDSRSSNSNITKSDHKSVIATNKIGWKYQQPQKGSKYLDINKLKDPQISTKFTNELS